MALFLSKYGKGAMVCQQVITHRVVQEMCPDRCGKGLVIPG